MIEKNTTETMQMYRDLDDRKRFFNELKDLSKKFVKEVKTQGTMTLTLSKDDEGNCFVFLQDYTKSDGEPVDYRAKYDAYYTIRKSEENG